VIEIAHRQHVKGVVKNRRAPCRDVRRKARPIAIVSLKVNKKYNLVNKKRSRKACQSVKLLSCE